MCRHFLLFTRQNTGSSGGTISEILFSSVTNSNSEKDYHYIFDFSVTMASEPQTPAQTIDYNFAREELMLNELSNDPIQTAIAKIERQHEEDKQGQ